MWCKLFCYTALSSTGIENWKIFPPHMLPLGYSVSRKFAHNTFWQWRAVHGSKGSIASVVKKRKENKVIYK
jgi:hypothetical protein